MVVILSAEFYRLIYQCFLRYAAVAAILILCLAAAFALPVRAAGAVEPGRDAELSLQYQIDGEAVSGLSLRIYRVADIDAEADFTLSGHFSNYSVHMNDFDSDYEWNAAAQTLAGYVQADDLKSDGEAVSSDAGAAAFGGLRTGLYLVMTETRNQSGTVITFSPFLVSLPGLNESDEWNYSPEVSPKGEKMTPPGNEITMKVVKQWSGDGNGSTRPDSIDIVIMKDGVEYAGRTLCADNDWSFSWSAKDDGSVWSVSERHVPAGYTVTSESEGTSVILTNTKEVTTAGSPPYTGYDGIRLWPSILLMAGGCGLAAFGLKIRNTKGGRNER